MVRALALLFATLAVSVALTMQFGHEVLVVFGALLTQVKLVAKKLQGLQFGHLLAWLKAEAAAFFRIEILKKWLMTSVLPLVIGKQLLNRVEAWTSAMKAAVARRFSAMMVWYAGLSTPVKVVSWLIVLAGTLGATVGTVGLWLILFSVKAPFWVVAALSTLLESLWRSLRKMAFKTLAFLQLGILWRVFRGRLPDEVLERKRRLEFRAVRRVVRRRRLTVRQLAAGGQGMGLRLAMWWEWVRTRWRGA